MTHPLASMAYSGRSIEIGMTPGGLIAVGYGLTSRSPPNRARRFEQDACDGTHVIRTNATDPEALLEKDRALTVYPALIAERRALLASNGLQTELLLGELRGRLRRKPLDGILPAVLCANAMADPAPRYFPARNEIIDIATYEPDSPNFTPRICGAVIGRRGGLYIVRRSEGGAPERIPYAFDLEPGQGHLIATYTGEDDRSKPLPAFKGEPLPVEMRSDSASDLAREIFEALGGHDPNDANNCIGAAAMVLQRNGTIDWHVENRFEGKE